MSARMRCSIVTMILRSSMGGMPAVGPSGSGEVVDGCGLDGQCLAVAVEERAEPGRVLGRRGDRMGPRAGEDLFVEEALERFLRVVEIGRQQGDAPCPSLAGALGDDGGRARGGGEEALGDSGGSEQSAVGVEELESHTLL